MYRTLIALSAVLLSACASAPPPIPTNYAGPDAGQVLVGIGAAKGTNYSSYSFYFRRADAAPQADVKQASGRFIYLQSNIFSSQKRDYDSAQENGVVLLSSLPPGKYEIHNFNIHLNAGTTQLNFGSKSDFSIPFEVQAGKAVYLGNYQANAIQGKNMLGLSAPAGAVFVVESRLDRDIALARARSGQPSVAPQVLDATPSASSINNPFFAAPK